MQLSEEELDLMGADGPQDNAAVPDSDEDIRPYTNKGRKNKRSLDEDDELEWTLRKCAAASLDGISFSFDQGEMLSVLMPHVHRMIRSETWLEREAAVLALGAISFGSADGSPSVLFPKRSLTQNLQP